MKKLLLGLLIFILPAVVSAEENNITEKCSISINDLKYGEITDDNYTTAISFSKDKKVNIKCEENIEYVYIYYHINPTKGKVNGKDITGEYLHDLTKVSSPSNEISIEYENNYAIADIYVFGNGELPSWVEDWQSLKDADMMLISTHADDEQLFFGGLLPLYVDKGKDIQVVYFTNHFNNQNRYHELLEGLWTVGIKYYPVMSEFPDEYSESLNDALLNFKRQGFTEEQGIKFLKDQINKYKPEVVVGHDEKGEYGHGQHMLSTQFLKEAIKDTNIKKLYLHLYQDKQITLDLDSPLKSFEGKSAFEMTKEGFKKHLSQQATWFTNWLNAQDKASEIKEYNPAVYGLYYSSVGDDTTSDMFDNITTKKVSTDTKDKKDETIKIKKKSKRNIKFGKFQIGLSIFLVLDLLAIIFLTKFITK